MATSSITENFVVEGKSQVEMFTRAIEESYQESLVRKEGNDIEITYVRDSASVKELMRKWEEANA